MRAKRLYPALVAAALVVVAFATPAWAPRAGVTTLVSVGRNFSLATSSSDEAEIDASGRFVAFASDASNIVEGDLNGEKDIFVRDLNENSTVRVTLGPGRIGEANGESDSPAISSGGRFVAFRSKATNFVNPSPAATFWQVYVHDRDADNNNVYDEPDTAACPPAPRCTATYLVSAHLVRNGENVVSRTPGNGDSGEPTLPWYDSRVAFSSLATNLVDGDLNGAQDVFVALFTNNVVEFPDFGAIQRISTNAAGQNSNGPSSSPAYSGDARNVAFVSDARNLVLADGNDKSDVFRWNSTTGIIDRVSLVPRTGQAPSESNGVSTEPTISYDGSQVAFRSSATNLGLAPDTNGFDDIFLVDLRRQVLELISVAGNGGGANGESRRPSLWANNFIRWADNPIGDARDALAQQTAQAKAAADERRADAEADVEELAPGTVPWGDVPPTPWDSVPAVPWEDIPLNDVYEALNEVTDSARPEVSLYFNEYGTEVSIERVHEAVVTFESDASNLADPVLDGADTNDTSDIYLRDVFGQFTERVSLSSTGEPADAMSTLATIGNDGYSVAFVSDASNLDFVTPGTTNVFVRDRSRCSTGTPEQGQVSSQVHERERDAGRLGPSLHNQNCDAVVGLEQQL